MHKPFTINYPNGKSKKFDEGAVECFFRALKLDYRFSSGIVGNWVKVVEITEDKSEIWVELDP